LAKIEAIENVIVKPTRAMGKLWNRIFGTSHIGGKLASGSLKKIKLDRNLPIIFETIPSWYVPKTLDSILWSQIECR